MGGYLSVLVPRYQGVSHSDYVCVTYMLAGHTSEEEEVLKGRIYQKKNVYISPSLSFISIRDSSLSFYCHFPVIHALSIATMYVYNKRSAAGEKRGN